MHQTDTTRSPAFTMVSALSSPRAAHAVRATVAESRDGASTQLPRRAADQKAAERGLETRGDGGKPRVERRRQRAAGSPRR
mmetsp:Transcript_35861/g.107277  ORF Transcript_35861/g.107277 Transcript_35861/m.107277 type:complete len:81 (+) Transcript_35861:64-306(+)